jgi:hypothetical protein
MRPICRSRLSAVILFFLLAVFLFSDTGNAQTSMEWITKLVSIRGIVHVQPSGQTIKKTARLDDIHSAGDMILVGEINRAAVVFGNEAVLRLDQNPRNHFSTVYSSKSEDYRTIRRRECGSGCCELHF